MVLLVWGPVRQIDSMFNGSVLDLIEGYGRDYRPEFHRRVSFFKSGSSQNQAGLNSWCRLAKFNIFFCAHYNFLGWVGGFLIYGCLLRSSIQVDDGTTE